MSWLGDKCVYPSPEIKNNDGSVEWTQEGGLTLFQHICIELAKGANHSMAGRYEDEGFAVLIADQARELVRQMQLVEKEERDDHALDEHRD